MKSVQPPPQENQLLAHLLPADRPCGCDPRRDYYDSEGLKHRHCPVRVGVNGGYTIEFRFRGETRVIMRRCAYCGREMTATRRSHRFCSDSCRAMASRRRPEAQLRKAEERGRKPSKYDNPLSEPGKRRKKR